MNERDQIRRLAIQVELRQGETDQSPRYLRALRTTQAIQAIMRDFIPQSRDVQRMIEDHLMETAFLHNLELINVPLEWDALTKLQIEAARMKRFDPEGGTPGRQI